MRERCFDDYCIYELTTRSKSEKAFHCFSAGFCNKMILWTFTAVYPTSLIIHLTNLVTAHFIPPLSFKQVGRIWGASEEKSCSSSQDFVLEGGVEKVTQMSAGSGSPAVTPGTGLVSKRPQLTGRRYQWAHLSAAHASRYFSNCVFFLLFFTLPQFVPAVFPAVRPGGTETGRQPNATYSAWHVAGFCTL